MLNIILRILAISFLLYSCTSLTPRLGQRAPANNSSFYSCTKGLKNLFESNNRLASSAGFEFEGAIPAQLSFFDIANLIRSHLKTKFPDQDIELKALDHSFSETEYQILLTKDGKDYTFSVKADGTLVIENKELKGIEITSPIMEDDNDFYLFLKILEDVRTKGLVARQDVGGIHFHYGLPKDKTFKELEVLYALFVKAEKSILEYFRVHPGRSHHSSANLHNALRAIQEIVQEAPQRNLENLDVEEIKKRSILRVIPTLRTWETRFFNSTLDPEINLFYKEFVNRLFAKWLNNDSELFEFINTAEEIDTKKLLEVLGFDLSKTDELMERLAYEAQLLDKDHPFETKVRDFWSTPEDNVKEVFIDESPDIFVELILRDSRFLSLNIELQEKLLKRAPKNLRDFHQLWREEIDINKLPELLDSSQDTSVFFHIFHQYQRINPEKINHILDSLDKDFRNKLYIKILNDYTRFGSNSTPSNSRKLSREFITLLTKIASESKSIEVTDQMIKILDVISLRPYPPKAGLTILADQIIENISQNPEVYFDQRTFLYFINRIKPQIQNKKFLAEIIQTNLITKGFDYSIFYQYLEFVSNFHEELLSKEVFDFIISVLNQFGPRLDQNQRFNLILSLYKFKLTPADKKTLEELIENLKKQKEN